MIGNLPGCRADSTVVPSSSAYNIKCHDGATRARSPSLPFRGSLLKTQAYATSQEGSWCSFRLKSESQCHSMAVLCFFYTPLTRPASTKGTQDMSFSGENSRGSPDSTTLGSPTAFDTLHEQLLIPLSICQKGCPLHAWETLKNQSGAEHINLWAHIMLSYPCV